MYYIFNIINFSDQISYACANCETVDPICYESCPQWKGIFDIVDDSFTVHSISYLRGLPTVISSDFVNQLFL